MPICQASRFCALAANDNQLDTEGDGIGDACDPDDAMLIVNGKLRLSVQQDGGVSSAFQFADTVDSIPTGVFTHVAGTFDTATQEIWLYFNGSPVPAPIGEGSSTISSIFDGTTPVTIGAYQGGTDGYFDGLIDEVDIFNRALTDAEIAEIYNAGSAGKCKSGGEVDPAGNTQPGSNVVVQPIDSTTGASPVTLTFTQVNQAGNTTLTIASGGPPPPSGFQLGNPPTWYDLNTTAIFMPPIQVCIDYTGVSFIDESALGFFHFENSQWIDITTSQDTVNNVICGSTGSLSPFAIFERNGPQVVFSSNRDGNFEIYGMRADGTGVVKLTNHSAGDLDPALSPDKSKIVFTSTRDGNFEIYSMNTDGTGLTRLTNHSAIDGFAAWSPTGAKIAFTSTRDGNSEIYSMNADGTVVTRLTNHSKIDANPAWSPDGSKIAFVSTRHNNYEIYSMNANGTGVVTRLTNHGEEDAFPTWSPDGLKIAFMSTRHGNAEIYTMNANGTGLSRLTTNSAIDAEPAWGSNGKIAFSTTRNGNSEIYSMNANGTGLMRLTNHSAWDISPHW